MLLPYACRRSIAGLIPLTSPRVPNLSERGPDGRKPFFGSPEDGPPKQGLASGPMRPAHGKARLARGQP